MVLGIADHADIRIWGGEMPEQEGPGSWFTRLMTRLYRNPVIFLILMAAGFLQVGEFIFEQSIRWNQKIYGFTNIHIICWVLTIMVPSLVLVQFFRTERAEHHTRFRLTFALGFRAISLIALIWYSYFYGNIKLAWLVAVYGVYVFYLLFTVTGHRYHTAFGRHLRNVADFIFAGIMTVNDSFLVSPVILTFLLPVVVCAKYLWGKFYLAFITGCLTLFFVYFSGQIYKFYTSVPYSELKKAGLDSLVSPAWLLVTFIVFLFVSLGVSVYERRQVWHAQLERVRDLMSNIQAENWDEVAVRLVNTFDADYCSIYSMPTGGRDVLNQSYYSDAVDLPDTDWQEEPFWSESRIVCSSRNELLAVMLHGKHSTRNPRTVFFSKDDVKLLEVVVEGLSKIREVASSRG